MSEVITKHLDLWTSAFLAKAGAARGGNGRVEFYGIKKLRELILDLAVRGILVSQNPADEPASKLIKTIASEKVALARRGGRKRLEGYTSNDDLRPHNLPSSWRWATLDEVCFKLTDGSHNPPRNAGSGHPMLSSQNVFGQKIDFQNPTRFVSDADFQEEDRRTQIGPDDVLLTIVASLGRAAVVPKDAPKFVLQRSVAVLKSGLDSHFLAMQLESPHCLEYYEAHGKGTAQKGIYLGKLAQMPIAVPPLEEQHRIVAKVAELMALCDQLEQQQTHCLEAHQTLVETLLGTLTSAASPQELNEAWVRIASHFDTLFVTESSVERLEDVILQLSVSGRLVPQNATDEPAGGSIRGLGDFVKPSRYEKRSAAKIEGLCALSLGETERKLPVGWLCVPLVRIARLESGHTPSRSHPEWWGGDVPWVGVVDARIHDGGIIDETLQHTNELGLANSSARLLPAGTVCISRTASVGYVIILGKSMATSQDFVNWVPSQAVTSDWLRLVFTAEKGGFSRFSKGAVHQTIYYTEWLAMHISLPPVAEQKRIVAKVDELMALCDTLKARLAEAQSTQVHLAEAIVEQAVA